MAYLLLGCLAVTAVTFGLAAATKIGRHAYREFRRSLPVTLRLPVRLSGPAAAAVLAAELLTAAVLLLGLWRRELAVLGFVSAALLLGGFTVAVAVMIRRGVRETCRCFGTGARPPGRSDVVRNLALLVIAVLGTVLALTSPGTTGTVEGEPMAELVTLLAAVGLVNVVITVAVLRQLREHSDLLRQSIEGVSNPAPVMRAAGESVRDFTATTVEGATVTQADLRGRTLVGFLSPDCPACAESLPSFILRAQQTPGGRERVLAVVAGTPSTAGAMRDRLIPVARVVVEPPHGPVAAAFGVIAEPAFAVLSGTTVVGSHFVLDRIPETVAA